MNIERMAKTLSKAYCSSVPGFTISIIPENILRYTTNTTEYKGCKVRYQSPYAGRECKMLQEMPMYNDDPPRSKKVEAYCKEFLEKLQKAYPEQAERFAEKLSSVQIKMGRHKTTLREIRDAIKERFLRQNPEAVFIQIEDTHEKGLETKYKTDLSKQTIKEMHEMQASGLSFSEIGLIQVVREDAKHELFHELLHQMTTKVDLHNNTKVGFSTDIADIDEEHRLIKTEDFGTALNEGMTEKTVFDLFEPNGKKEHGAYREFQIPCEILELCVGRYTLQKAFFTCDIYKITEALGCDEQEKQEFMQFIRSLDFIYDNYTYGEVTNNDQKEFINKVFKEVGNYLTRLFTKTLEKEIAMAREQNYDQQHLRQLAQSQKERIQKFYKYMNEKLGPRSFKYGDTKTMLKLKLGIDGAILARSR